MFLALAGAEPVILWCGMSSLLLRKRSIKAAVYVQSNTAVGRRFDKSSDMLVYFGTEQTERCRRRKVQDDGVPGGRKKTNKQRAHAFAAESLHPLLEWAPLPGIT